ncbi:hypothetical protein HDV00_001365 [Rhizophlyctis rosea]|nr:hypothetical protein HDV00_001365 [Rhizophlyctis rosea]
MKIATILFTALAAAQAVSAKTVYIYGTKVNVRTNSGSCATKPSTSCAAFTSLTHANVEAKCQRQGASVTVSGVGTNNWWTLVKVGSRWGWVTNLYVQGGHKIAGVPDCTSSSTPAPKPSGGSSTHHVTSGNGRKFIEGFEGYRANFYYDSAGVKTIGYGHACQPSSSCNSIHAPLSRAQADALFAKDLKRYESSVNSLVKTALTQNQFDALVSFTYNLGAGNLRNIVPYLNKRQFKTATDHMLKYTHAGGKVLPGLVRRRKAEVALFNK